MTENELKINGKSFSETISQIEEFMESDDVHGELFTVLRSARDFMENLNEEIQQYREIAKNKHIGKDNMVISSSDLMTILNSDSEELKEVRKGFEENRKAGYKHGYADGYAKGIDDLVNGLLNWKSQDEEYKSFRDVCNEIAEQLKGGAE